MIKPQTLKGFRDFLPDEAKKRQIVINELKNIFEEFDFQPLETPALEYEEILLGKYGEEGDNLMYRFQDNGGRKVALRYDQTVPLARVVAQYQSSLSSPFKRYQIQNVWRGENTQRGRYREFLQCDADIVGSSSSRADAQIIMVATAGLIQLGFKEFTVFINDREIFKDIPLKAIIAIDKLKKIGKEGVYKELTEKNISKNLEDAKSLLSSITEKNPTSRLNEIFTILNTFKDKDTSGVKYQFDPTLARGLSYYTGTIFEIEIKGYTAGSICGGGRYDNLIGIFANKQIPAVGFSYGFDRVMEAIEELNLPIIKNIPPITQVLITIFSEELKTKSLEIAKALREKNIKAELYLGDDNTKIEKQLKYADQKNIPYALIIGPEEAQKSLVTLKNLKTREQTQHPIENLPEILR
jgi:histidyl-tRNA synthetase